MKWLKRWDILRHWREVFADAKLYHSGHRRCAPYGTKGRVYEKAGSGGPVIRAKAVVAASIRPSRVYCAKEGKWYSVEEWLVRQGEIDG
jgi:hypothetical protein